MLGRRTYQNNNNFSRNSVVTVVVEKTITQIRQQVRLTTIPSNVLTNVDMGEGLENKDGIALIAFGDNRVIMSVVRGIVNVLDDYSTGSDALGNLIVAGQWAQLTTGSFPLDYVVTFTSA